MNTYPLFTDRILLIARKALLDPNYRSQLFQEATPPEQIGTGDDILSWIESLRNLDTEELLNRLWKAATSGRPSTWRALQRMLRTHLTAVRKLMLRILDEMPGDNLYGNAIATIVRKGKATVTRTPSSVLWCFAVMQSQKGEITPDIYPLAAACAFYYQGVVLFDDIADGELGPYCAGWPEGQAEHIALSMTCALPLFCVQRLQCSDSIKQKITADFANAMWFTNYGQFLDLGGHETMVFNTKEAEKISLFKAGVGYANLTRAAAHFLQINDKYVADWAGATEVFSVARQMASDIYDLWRKTPSVDLVSGKFTWPLAYAAQCLPAEEVHAFKTLLVRSQYDLDARSELYELLNRMDILNPAEARLSELKKDGLSILNRLRVSSPAKRWILTWASQASVFGDVS